MIDLVLTFLKIGTFTFGGGMVMVAFLEQDAVHRFGWLSQQEFIDAVAMGQMTPGPIVISSVFIGYKVAGLLGAVLAMGSISLPSFLMTIAVTGQLQRLRTSPYLRAVLAGVGPAVAGLILAAGVSIGRMALVDWRTALLAVLALVALVRFKADAAVVVLVAGAVGYLFL